MSIGSFQKMSIPPPQRKLEVNPLPPSDVLIHLLLSETILSPLPLRTEAFSQDPKRGHPILVQQHIYSKERRGGGGVASRKCSSGKPLKFTLLHVSICSKLVRNFSNTLGFVILCRYASLLKTTTFSFSQIHHQIYQNVKCIIIMRIEAISFQIY